MAGVGDPRGFYQLLGVHRTATSEEIRVAFRDRAKIHHPDSGQGNDERFQRLREAYDALRDPHRRLQYDAEGLEAERQRDRGRRAGITMAAEPPAAQGFATLATAPRALAVTAAGLAVALVLALGALWVTSSGRGAEEAAASARTAEIEALRAGMDELQARYRAASFTSLDQALSGQAAGPIFRADLRFPAGSAELTAELRQGIERGLSELGRQIRSLPQGKDWLVLVEAQSARAATADGVLVDAWELPLLRLATIVDRLVTARIPVERLAVRFHAGFAAPAGGSASDVVELKLLCCMQAPS